MLRIVHKMTHSVPLRRIVALLGVLVLVAIVVANPQNLKTEYGSGGGLYADQVDSFSEYIVRNTVTANLTGQGPSLITPVVTRGYGEGDYNFTTLEGANPYYSNPVFQVVVLSELGRLLSVNSADELGAFFSLLRLLNAFILIGSIFLSSLYIARGGGKRLSWSVHLLIVGSTGLVYFSQNLYFLSALFFLPLVIMTSRDSRPFNLTAFLIFAASLVFFLRGYEFATTYALFNSMMAAVVAPGGLRAKMLRAVVVFTVVCLAFLLAVASHVGLIVVGSFGEISALTALALIGSAGLRRVASFEAVPIPFSIDFLSVVWARLQEPALSYIILEISQGAVLVLVFLCALVFWSRLGTDSKLILAFSPFVYFSWYVFGYQHIMSHNMYDWYIFAVSITVPLCFLIALNGRSIHRDLPASGQSNWTKSR